MTIFINHGDNPRVAALPQKVGLVRPSSELNVADSTGSLPDQIQVASEDSFPASDPPAWTAITRIGPPPVKTTPTEPVNLQPKADEEAVSKTREHNQPSVPGG